jgi:predicted DCC family thiol-disulfide oxidoreductase YuxK
VAQETLGDQTGNRPLQSRTTGRIAAGSRAAKRSDARCTVCRGLQHRLVAARGIKALRDFVFGLFAAARPRASGVTNQAALPTARPLVGLTGGGVEIIVSPTK